MPALYDVPRAGSFAGYGIPTGSFGAFHQRSMSLARQAIVRAAPARHAEAVRPLADSGVIELG